MIHMNSFEKFINDPKMLFEKLNELRVSENNQEILKQLIINLNKNHSVDICEIAIVAINEKESVFDIIEILKDAFPYLNYNISSIIQFLRSCFNAIGNDICSDDQYTLIKELAKEQPELADEIGTALLKIDEPFIINYISTIYEYFSISEIEKVHKFLIIKTASKEEFIIQAVIFSLSKLEYWDNKKEILAEETLNVYEKLLTENSTSINSSIAWGLNQFICKTDRAKDILLVLIQENNDTVSFQIARLLSINFNILISKEWFDNVLLQFTKTKSEQTETIRHIDILLSQYSKRDQNTIFAEKFIQEWIVNSNYISKPIELGAIWSTTLRNIYKNEISLSRFTTNLFNSDDIQCHVAISKTIEHAKSYYKRDLKLDRDLLNKLNFESILFICRKIIGYIISSDIIYSLLDSIVQNFEENHEIIDLICEVYVEYLSKDYSNTTANYIEKTLTEIEPGLLKTKLEIAYKTIKERHEQLATLPRLKELATSRRNLYQISLEESKKHSKLFNKAEEKSFMSLFTKNTPLKYGNGWFHYYNGEYSDISKLAKFSSSVEIPKRQITQPISYSLERINFRLAKRTEV